MSVIPCAYPWISKTVQIGPHGMYPNEIAGFVQSMLGSHGTVELHEMYDDGDAVHIAIALQGMPRKLRLTAVTYEGGIEQQKPGFNLGHRYYVLRICHYEGDEPKALPLRSLMRDITKAVTGFAAGLEGTFTAAPRDKNEWPRYSEPDTIPVAPKHDPAVA